MSYVIDIIVDSLSGCETTTTFICTLFAIIFTFFCIIGFIQLMYNSITQRDPYSQSPHWIGNIFRLFIKILIILVKLLSYIAIGAVWIYFKTRILLYIIWAKITGKKPDIITPPPYNPSNNYHSNNRPCNRTR